jgi:uncharacterized protein with PQ loop repeat
VIGLIVLMASILNVLNVVGMMEQLLMQTIDIIMAIVNVAFCLGFIPQIVKSTKSLDMACFSWFTLWISSVGVTVLAVCFFVIDKPFTGFINGLVAVCWFYLLGLKITLDKNVK